MSKIAALVDYTTLHDATYLARATYSISKTEWQARQTKSRTTGLREGHPWTPGFVSLAELIENVVLFDEIYVARLGPGPEDELSSLTNMEDTSGYELVSYLKKAGILHEIELTTAEVAELASHASALAESEAFLENFSQSLETLISQPGYQFVPSRFLTSMSAYRGEAKEFWHSLQSTLRDSVSEAFQKSLAKQLRRHFPERGKKQKKGHEEGVAMVDFYLRGLLYNELAKLRGLAYCPDSARTPIIECDVLASSELNYQFGKIAVHRIEALRGEIAKDLNEFLGKDMIALDIPSILAAVLRETDSQKDVFKVAVQLRESDGAKALREWSARLRQVSLQGDMKALSKMRDEMKSVLTGLRKEVGLQKQEGEVQLWIFSIPITIPKFLQRTIIPPWKRHLLFLRDLFRKIQEVKAVEELLRIYHTNS